MKNKTLENIIKNYSSNIQNIIKNITGQDNEDIEQEVYIKTWKNLDKYKEKGSFSSWIKTITTNTCRDYFRSKQFKQNQQISDNESALELVKTKENNELDIEKTQRQKSIINAINKLKPKHKEIIILYDIQELQYDEIAKKLNCPIGTVKSRLFKARKILQEELKDLL